MTAHLDAQLRPMRWWDIETVAELEDGLFPQNAWSAEAFWSELAQRESREYLVAEAGGALLGYAGLLLGPGEADVLTLLVTRGPNFPLSRLAQRLMCPRCGTREVLAVFEPPARADAARAARYFT